ncbi:MAG: hypothetical protein GY789_24140, partial [Hyphomicrobiales bacterium]|nr:hypothetical protein [Hyphomicrobiales bacterium]
MDQADASVKNRFDLQAIIMLGMAFVLLVLANGKFSVPVAAWLGPVFMVRFVRTQGLKIGLPIGYVTLVVMLIISWQGMIPIPFLWALSLVFAIIGVIFLLPYMIDRLLVGQITGFLATLILPIAWVSIDFINAHFNPYGGWGMIAYSQHGNLPLLQLLSLTGIWGVTFVVVWFAAVANWAWEQEFKWEKIRAGVIVYVGIVAAILVLGGARLAVFPPDAETVRVASISAKMPRESISRGTDADGVAIALKNQNTHDELFRLSEIGARVGSKFILWAEANAQIDKEAEPTLIERGQDFARQHQVYLSMALFTRIPGQYLRENK